MLKSPAGSSCLALDVVPGTLEIQRGLVIVLGVVLLQGQHHVLQVADFFLVLLQDGFPGGKSPGSC